MFDVTGKLYVIFDSQQVTERFKKREFVLEIQNGNFSEYVKFQLTQDRCGLLDTAAVGNEVKVRFALKGKPYQKGSETLYFTNLEALHVETSQFEKIAPPPSNDYWDVPPPTDEDSNLPF